MPRLVPCLFLALLAAGCEINTKIDADGAVNGPKVGNGGEGEGEGEASVNGAVALGVVEADCIFRWALAGSNADCSGCDLAFEVSLTDNGGDCGDGGDLAGTLEFDGGVAYFNDYYWGLVTSQGGGLVEWYTYDYIYGSNYSYLYAGYAYY